METFIAKIYTENKDTLVLEVCTNHQINNILKLSSANSPYVRIIGAKNVAISEEAKLLFIDILHKAQTDYNKRTSLSIIQYYNSDVLITWDGANKQKINVNNMSNLKVGLGLGFFDERLLELIPVKDNNFLKNYKFSESHADDVTNYLKQQYKNLPNSKNKAPQEREM